MHCMVVISFDVTKIRRPTGEQNDTQAKKRFTFDVLFCIILGPADKIAHENSQSNSFWRCQASMTFLTTCRVRRCLSFSFGDDAQHAILTGTHFSRINWLTQTISLGERGIILLSQQLFLPVGRKMFRLHLHTLIHWSRHHCCDQVVIDSIVQQQQGEKCRKYIFIRKSYTDSHFNISERMGRIW